jgi:two-component system phosphate regulon sensor histidine kinase PhoR
VAKRQSFLIGAIFLISALLFVPSLKARVIAALLVITAFVIWLVVDRRRGTANENSTASDRDTSVSPETFARSALFEATMGGMREGLLVVDRDMRVIVSNPAVDKLFSAVTGKPESQRLTQLTRNPAIYDAFLDGLKGIDRTGVKVETHGAYRQVFDLSVLPLGSLNGSGAQGALGVFFDVTRTERLEVVRQEFLSNVSHELRTPLTAILAFVETLENGALDDREASRRFLEIIRKNANRMHTLIDDILELTAIEGGNVQLRAATVELHPLVSEVVTSLAAKSSNSGMSLVNEVPGGVEVYADSRRLEQMLTNLVDNGIKFGRERGQVTVKYVAGVRDQIIVEDNGEGIPAQHLERLFERFYRVDRARSRDMGGTGLGLAIVKHLALLHGGEVTVESELGKGTQFTIHLPKSQPLQ